MLIKDPRWQKLVRLCLQISSGYLANCKLAWLRLRYDTWTMALNFLNQRRSYDATLHAVRFWGHDGAMEVSFYVNEDALKRIQPGLGLGEAEILGASDANRNLIHVVAAKAYRRGRKSSYGLFPLISDRQPVVTGPGLIIRHPQPDKGARVDEVVVPFQRGKVPSAGSLIIFSHRVARAIWRNEEATGSSLCSIEDEG
jgi:hypothetical protein